MEANTLLERVEEFLALSGMTPTAFGRAAANDPAIVFDLRAGRECRNATQIKILGYIAVNAPTGSVT